MTDKETFKEFLTSKPVAFYPDFSEVGGSTNAGVLLSQLFYWRDKQQDPDGWIYKSQKDWKREICLTRTEQENARKKLRDSGIMQEKLKGNPAKLYFRIDFEKLISALSLVYEARRQDAGNLHAEKPHAKDAGNLHASMRESSKLSLAENTTKTTTENTTASIDAGKSKKTKPVKARKNTYPSKEFADIFEKGYPALHGGEKFPWGKQSGKWGKHFQIIWELSDENMDKVREMAGILFRTIRGAKLTDTFWRQAGFTPTTLSSRWTQLQPVSANASTLSDAVDAKPFPAYQTMTLEEIEIAFEDWSAKWGYDVAKKHISPESFSRFMDRDDGEGFAANLPRILDRENRERVHRKSA